MFALFHSVPYEGESFLGVFSSLELAQEAGHSYVTADEDDPFYGRLEVFPYEPGTVFHVAFLQQPVWSFSP